MENKPLCNIVVENTTQKSTYNNLWSQIASPPATPDTQVQRPRIPAYSSFSSHHSRPHTNRRPQPQHNGVKSYFREHSKNSTINYIIRRFAGMLVQMTHRPRF